MREDLCVNIGFLFFSVFYFYCISLFFCFWGSIYYRGFRIFMKSIRSEVIVLDLDLEFGFKFVLYN